MSNAFQQLPTISWEEFTSLEWPHEWVEGAAYAMGATTPRHAAATGLIGDHFHRTSGEPVPARNST